MSVYPLVFVLIEKMYQTLQTIFQWLSKHLECRQKYSAAWPIFNSLLSGYRDENCLLCLIYYFKNAENGKGC